MSPLRPLALSSHIFVADADAAVGFYREVFGATELFRNHLPDGRVLFVELAFGPGKLLVSEEIPELGAIGPHTLGGSPALLLLEFDDIDAVAEPPHEPAPTSRCPSRRCSGASATASSATPSDTAGRCAHSGKRSPPIRSPAGSRPT